MRFLLDQDDSAITARFLNDLGHDAVAVATIGRSRATDSELLRVAAEKERILVTRDKDFGALVFVRELRVGVIYLRVGASSLGVIHHELNRILASYSERELRQAFVVVEPGRHRFRSIQAS